MAGRTVVSGDGTRLTSMRSGWCCNNASSCVFQGAVSSPALLHACRGGGWAMNLYPPLVDCGFDDQKKGPWQRRVRMCAPSTSASVMTSIGCCGGAACPGLHSCATDASSQSGDQVPHLWRRSLHRSGRFSAFRFYRFEGAGMALVLPGCVYLCPAEPPAESPSRCRTGGAGSFSDGAPACRADRRYQRATAAVSSQALRAASTSTEPHR